MTDEPVDELRFAGNVHFYGGTSARDLAAGTGLLYRGGIVFVEYLDEADQHWTVLLHGDAYRAQVTPFLDVEGKTHLESTGPWQWKPDEILMTLPGWIADWRAETAPTPDPAPPTADGAA